MLNSNPSDSIEFSPTPGTTGGGIQTFLEEMYARDSRATSSSTPTTSEQFDQPKFASIDADSDTPKGADTPMPPSTFTSRNPDGGTTTLEFAADGRTVSRSVQRDADGKMISVSEYQPDGKRLKLFETYDSDQKLRSSTEFDENGADKTITLYENGVIKSRTEVGTDGRKTSFFYKDGTITTKIEEGEKGNTSYLYENGKLRTKFEPMPDGKGGTVATRYNPDGSKDTTTLLDKNNRMTTYYRFGSNGKVIFEAVYPQNGPTTTTLYDKDGSIKARTGDSKFDMMLRASGLK